MLDILIIDLYFDSIPTIEKLKLKDLSYELNGDIEEAMYIIMQAVILINSLIQILLDLMNPI